MGHTPGKCGPPDGGHGGFCSRRGACPAGMHPPFSFPSCGIENGPCTVQKKRPLWRAPVQWPSVRTGVSVSVQAPIWACLQARYHLLRGRYYRPVADGADLVGVVVVLPQLLFSLPLTLPCGRASGSENRRRMYPKLPRDGGFPKGSAFSSLTAARDRQPSPACADRPAEHFFFSTGRGAFSF